MRKTFIAFFVLFLFVSRGSAQIPVENNQNILVNSRELGEDLLLFVPDTATQILFNPARAANYDKSFIYTTYNSNYQGGRYSTSNVIMRIGDIIIYNSGYYSPRNKYYYYPNYSSLLPTISTVSLLNIADSKWLFSFSNGIRHSDSEDNDDRIEWYPYNYPYDTRTIKSSEKGDSKFSTTSARVIKIGENYSIGIFGTFNQIKTQSEYSENEKRSRKSETSNYIHHDSDSELRSVYSKGNHYQIGTTFSFTGNKWDYLGKFSYQKSDNLYDSKYNNLSHRIDSTGYDSTSGIWNIHERKTLRNGATFTKNKPDFYQFYSYYQRQTEWLSKNDHIFIKANAVLSKGSIEYSQNIQNFYTNAYQDTITSSDITNVAGSGKTSTDDIWLNLSFGYAATLTLDEIYILISLNPFYQYSHITDIPFTSYSYRFVYSELLNERKRTYNDMGVRIPLYANFSPVNWIDFYGGITYEYAYTDLDEKNILVSDFDTNTSDLKIEDSHKRTAANISSFRSKFLGINLKHKSGIKLQISFNNDIANFSYWDLSLGYHF